jgi:hypothetical protein
MCRGHGCRGSAIMRGTAENGCAAAPAGLKNRSPSKWSLVRGVTTRSSLIHVWPWSDPSLTWV